MRLDAPGATVANDCYVLDLTWGDRYDLVTAYADNQVLVARVTFVVPAENSLLLCARGACSPFA